MQKVKYTLKGGVGHVDISLHLLHVIINSIQALCTLSHLQISHRMAQFHINVYCLKMNLMRELQCQRWFYHLFQCSKIFGRYPLRTNLEYLLVVTPTPAAVEHDAILTECPLNIEISIPASAIEHLSHLTMVLLYTGTCCPIT